MSLVTQIIRIVSGAVAFSLSLSLLFLGSLSLEGKVALLNVALFFAGWGLLVNSAVEGAKGKKL